jgi:hypothetical protein
VSDFIGLLALHTRRFAAQAFEGTGQGLSAANHRKAATMCDLPTIVPVSKSKPWRVAS